MMEPMKPMEPMRPMEPMLFEQWWPKDLGHPSTAGAQNGVRYAIFPEARRLLIDRNGRLTTYDTGDHRISGVSSQQQGGYEGTLMFSSQRGPVRLDDLHAADPAPHGEAERGDWTGRGTHAVPTGGSQTQYQGGGVQGQSQDASSGEHRRERSPDPAPTFASGAVGESERERSQPAPAHRETGAHAEVPLGAGERVVFSEESGASGYMKVIVKGDIDLDMVEALEDFVRRHKRRLTRGG